MDEKGTDKLNWYYYRPIEGSEDRTICQYMRLDYLIQLLETGKYYVKRRREFEDANESYKNIRYAFAPSAVGNNVGFQPTQKRLIQYTDIVNCPTSCWSKRVHESYLMWKSYATEIGACIITTVHNFIASLQIDLDIASEDNLVLCGSIDYNNFRPSTNEEKQLFEKDIVYSDEDEFRFYFLLASDSNKKNGVYIPVNTEVMIGEILLSPFICKDAADKLAKMIKCAYDIEVKQSNIRLKL